MKHKKKIILSIVAVVMLICAFVGVSFAYFTDTTTSTNNVVTAGRIKIVQDETNRIGEPVAVAGTSLLPVVEAKNEVDRSVTHTIGGVDYNFYTHKNLIERVISLRNVGANNAYVRTIIAVPKIGNDLIKLVKNEYTYLIRWVKIDNVTISGVVNTIWVGTYVNYLEPGETSAPSLMQFYLDKTATSADLEGVTNVSISVVSQAVQQGGFEDYTPEEALNEAFGGEPISATHHPFA